MNRSIPFMLLCALIAVGSSASADETSVLHRDNLQSFCVFGNCWNADHTWAESNSTGCMNDSGSSFNGMSGSSNGAGSNICASTVSDHACSWVRGPFNASWTYTDVDACTNYWTHYGNCYNNASPGTYIWNGMCHQETNRSFFHSSMPWVESMPIGGADISHGIWGYCGAANPWGSTYDCGC